MIFKYQIKHNWNQTLCQGWGHGYRYRLNNRLMTWGAALDFMVRVWVYE